MLYRAIALVYCKNHMEYIICGQYTEFLTLNVTVHGNHETLKGLGKKQTTKSQKAIKYGRNVVGVIMWYFRCHQFDPITHY
jgi:hypothetical protein